MRFDEYVRRVERTLHPTVYSGRVETLPSHALRLLLTEQRGSARYALGVARCGPDPDLRAWRREVRALLGARFLWSEVGLYLVLCGAVADWSSTPHLRPDRTGLHAVTVQAIHCIDPTSGEADVRLAAWGPWTFGGSSRVASALDQLFEDGISGSYDVLE